MGTEKILSIIKKLHNDNIPSTTRIVREHCSHITSVPLIYIKVREGKYTTNPPINGKIKNILSLLYKQTAKKHLK